MNMDRKSQTVDEYFETALQIFNYCGTDSSGTLCVDELMGKFAPFVKTNKAEFSQLKLILDPEETNPEIDVTKLASALTMNSERNKVDFDESFNSRTGQMPQDSDSGISTDGFQLLEELQCELREKSFLAKKLRSQLDFTDRQHEEVVATLTAERDSLRSNLNKLREENLTLIHSRSDYDDVCDRLSACEDALCVAKKEIEVEKKKGKVLTAQVYSAEIEIQTLQEQLNKSKDECHRINDMYASRQSALLEENETLKTARADLGAKLQDQEELVRQLMKDKILLEMELKESVNRWNQTQSCLDRSVEVSYTEDQMLSALDHLTAVDSRFSQENRILDEDSFVNALMEETGRSTNMSLFDEIRLSFSNTSKLTTIEVPNEIEDRETFETSLVTIGTQTDEGFCENEPYPFNDITENNKDVVHSCLNCEKVKKELHLELKSCEDKLIVLQTFLTKEDEKNNMLQRMLHSLQSKIGVLDKACEAQKEEIDKLVCESCYAECQTECESVSVGTQADAACGQCAARGGAGGLRRYLWSPLKSLFQIFAVICFMTAIAALYRVSRRHPRCPREPLGWSWFDTRDILDLLLRIEYAEVPM